MEAYRAPQRPKTPEATAQKKEALLHLAGRSSLYTKGDRLLTYYTTTGCVCGVNWYHRVQYLYTCSMATSVTETAFRNSGLTEQKRVNRRAGSSQPYKKLACFSTEHGPAPKLFMADTQSSADGRRAVAIAPVRNVYGGRTVSGHDFEESEALPRQSGEERWKEAKKGDPRRYGAVTI